MKIDLSFPPVFRAIVFLTIGAAIALGSNRKHPIKQFKPIYDGKLMCAFEETNEQYAEFLNDLKIAGHDSLYWERYPDTAQWVNRFPEGSFEPMKANYFQHSAYKNYPVVNLSLEDITHYLRWKTAKYGNYRNDSVVFRLPNEDEWEEALFVGPGQAYPWEGNSIFQETKKGLMPRANLKSDNPGLKIMADGGFLQTAVESYQPNNRGIYQMIGNVAELTFEGLIKGGSWNNTLFESGVHEVQDFELPHPCVGFRVLATVHPRKQ